MWSVALIVGIAVAASVPVMGAGIALAIICERYRHRKYMQRQHAVAPVHRFSTASRIEVGNDHTAGISRSPRKTALEASPDTWTTLTSSETLCRQDTLELTTPSDDLMWIENTNLHRPLKGSVKKKRVGGRRRLKRTTPLQRVLNSPLSAITENSDCSDHSSGYLTSPTITTRTLLSDQKCHDEPSSWGLTVNKRRTPTTQDGLVRTGNKIHSNLPLQSVAVRRSVSFSSIASPAPADPLPQLPVPAVLNNNRPFSRSDSSRSSIDSVGSSVLETTVNSPPKPSLLVGKTNSQALRELNFGLGPSMRLTSPAYLSPLAGRNERAAATISMRASIRCNSDSETLPLANMGHNVTRNSPDAVPNTQGDDASCGKQRSCAKKTLPFVASNTKVGAPDQDPFSPSPVPDAHNQSLFVFKGLSPNPQIQNGLGIAEAALEDSMREKFYVRPSFSPTFSTVKQTKYRPASSGRGQDAYNRGFTIAGHGTQQLAPRKDNIKVMRESPPLTGISTEAGTKPLNSYQCLSKGMKQITPATPTTPDLTRSHYWHFDFDLVNTPKMHVVTSPFRSYDSPLLPSPKLTSAYMFPLPRNSGVRGPRKLVGGKSAPRSQSRTPFTTPKTNQDAAVIMIKDTLPSDTLCLQKSVAFLRNYSSQSQFSDRSLSADHEKENRRPAHLSVAPLKLHRPQSGRMVSQPTTTVGSMDSTSATLDINANTTSDAFQSPELPDDASVWEDESVREDSPDPETQLRKSASIQLSLPAGHDILVLEGNTFLPPPGEPRADDDTFVASNQKAKTATCQSRKQHGGDVADRTKSQLNVFQSNVGVHQNRSKARRSLYDESGFLKEQ